MTASIAQQEIWHVMLAADDMKRMNVDQLDDAFRLDLVDTSTLVWKTGMEGWRRLGSIAGIDDEPETIARGFVPPSPPPPPRPRTQPYSVAPQVNPFLATAVNPFASTTPAAVFNAPLLAPVYTPPLVAPDPYVLPKRRAKVPSEVDFRRASGIRWGRWLLGFLLLTTGVLAAYRQDYLRHAALQLGMENKYIHGERRVTNWVTAKAPHVLQGALTRAKLLPGPNALPASAPKPALMPAPETAAAAAVGPTKAKTPTTDSDVKIVSLDSLPTEQATPEPARAADTPAPAPRAKAPVAQAQPKVEPRPAKKQARPAREEEPAPAPKAKAEPKPEAPKPERKAPKAPPASMNDTPLKAAIWQSMQESAKKGK